MSDHCFGGGAAINAQKLVSIVIPTYNRERDLERALKSVLAQSYTHWEAIVVDNHSSDNTDGLVNGFQDPRIKLFKIHNAGVISASRNLGIREAKGEYVAFLDSDDWWTPDKLDVSVRALEAGSDIVYHDLTLVKNSWVDHLHCKVKTWQPRSPIYADLMRRGNALLNSSVVVRRDLMLGIGGLSENPDLTAAEDFDCWLRLAMRTERFQRLPGSLGYYWCAGGNTTSPDRTIRNLSALAGLHLKDAGELPLWYRYSLGRAYYCTGRFDQAYRLLAAIPLAKTKLMIALKVLYMRSKMWKRRIHVSY